jgi:hypothetical protein
MCCADVEDDVTCLHPESSTPGFLTPSPAAAAPVRASTLPDPASYRPPPFKKNLPGRPSEEFIAARRVQKELVKQAKALRVQIATSTLNTSASATTNAANIVAATHV